MAVDFTISLSHILTVFFCVSGLIGQWFVLKYKCDENSEMATKAFEESVEAKKEIADLRLEMLKDYASTRSLQAVEQRLAGSITDLTVEIRQLRNFLMGNKNI